MFPAANVNLIKIYPHAQTPPHFFWGGVGYKAIRMTIVALNPTQAKAENQNLERQNPVQVQRLLLMEKNALFLSLTLTYTCTHVQTINKPLV